MRNWEGERSRSNPPPFQQSFSLANADYNSVQKSAVDENDHGPELLLTPVQEYITNRDDSPVRRGSNRRSRVSPATVAQYSIPVAEILTVNTSTRKINVTTLSLGFFEFDNLTENAHDILLAFLQASLQPERIIKADESHCSGINSTNSVTSCLDIDTLQARHLQGRAERETWPEKFSRRVGHVVNSLQELSSTLCDAACCRDTAAESREMPEKTYRFQDLELDTECSSPARTMESSSSVKAASPKRPHKIESLPSGLSVEPDSELESVR
jgi:hypothetical protein